MSLPPRRDHQRLYWRLIRSGSSVADASACLGLSETAGKSWFRHAGGMPPLSLVENPKTRALDIDDREQIFAGINQNLTIQTIADSIGRAPSTVSRELRANTGNPANRTGSTGRFGYSPHLAQKRADARAARPKKSLLATNQRLHDEVQNRLKQNHSPEQISHRLAQDFPDDPEMRVSHETIYESLYVQTRGALNRELTKHLRTGRKLRRPRRNSKERRGRIPGQTNISKRPAEIEDRAVPGHWEGDLIVGKNSASAIGTLVERKTGFTALLHLPERHGALEVQQAMIEAMSLLPQILKQTLTWDQGAEMSNHIQIAAATDLAIYFCDPHSPWQRGSNENTNGLLRQYFPKGTDLSIHGAGYLEYVAAELNNRPRKRLGWKTPAEALDALLSEPLNPPTVAMTA